MYVGPVLKEKQGAGPKPCGGLGMPSLLALLHCEGESQVLEFLPSTLHQREAAFAAYQILLGVYLP